jgi:uncharacterized protein
MKIRSVTCLLEPGWPPDKRVLKEAARLVSSAQKVFHNAGYEVQTARLATPPFPIWLSGEKPGWLAEGAAVLERAVKDDGIEYLSLGPALPSRPESFDEILPALAVTQGVFFSGVMTSGGGGVSLPAIHACADIITKASGLSPDGFTNLRFAALANVPAGGAFFPAAYHAGGKPSFSIATEAADLAVQAFSGAQNLAQARQRLIDHVEQHADVLGAIALQLAKQVSFDFGGFDFTLASFPQVELSIGKALEMLGVPALGSHGSLAAAAFLVDSLDRARYPRAGFNGLMLPLLEDAVLAQRGAQGILSVKDLLLFSTVCGTGLDTIPLPGDTTTSQIAAVLLDLTTLAQRLDKPLTARLMPVPGKQAGEMTQFSFPYFANSRVLPLEADPLTGLLAGNESFSIRSKAK